MPLKVKNRRDCRYVLPADMGAEIEFDVPFGGHYRLQLLNISSLGVAFFVPGPILEFETGTMVNDAEIHVSSKIHVGSVVIRGNLVLRHTPRDHPSSHECGAQF